MVETGLLVAELLLLFTEELLSEVLGAVAEVALMEMMTSIIDVFVCPGPNDAKEPGDEKGGEMTARSCRKVCKSLLLEATLY